MFDILLDLWYILKGCITYVYKSKCITHAHRERDRERSIKGCCFDGDKQVATRPRRIDGTPWATDDARYAIDLIKLELRNTKKHRL